MAKAKRDTPGFRPLLGMAVVAALLLAGLIYYVKFGPQAELKPTAESPAAKSVKVKVPVVQRAGPDARFTIEERTVPAGSDPVVEAVNAFLEGVQFVQPEARLLSVRAEGENLTLEFSSNFNQTYGTDDEATLLKGIMRAVFVNSGAKTVTLIVTGGKPIETLGNIDITGPQAIRDWLG